MGLAAATSKRRRTQDGAAVDVDLGAPLGQSFGMLAAPTLPDLTASLVHGPRAWGLCRARNS